MEDLQKNTEVGRVYTQRKLKKYKILLGLSILAFLGLLGTSVFAGLFFEGDLLAKLTPVEKWLLGIGLVVSFGLSFAFSFLVWDQEHPPDRLMHHLPPKKK